ncbi:hypothetical protein [Shinella pollutisoli]|uniref:MarR family transcriptional regulator n=1 Tax=Shinella pollutisoli TaxID=2250594 RepID=A0ABV7D9D7_9HYPH|nr:hypothetical protein [Shinella pollutisoli]
MVRARYRDGERPAPEVPPEPLGPRGVALLRRIRFAGGSWRCERNRDRDAAGACEMLGYVCRDRRDEELLLLTDAGAAHLDRLMRAH